MRTVVHLSDLHFCRIDLAAADALQESVRELAPDLIAVSGDLTQRALKREFTAAREFLDTFTAPKLVVPGNHDVPLYDIATRLLKPHMRFQAHFDANLEPVFQDDEMTVAGVNTARAFPFKGGRINRDQVRRVAELFCGHGDNRIRIVVTHHPFDLPPLADKRDLVGRAEMAMSGFRGCMPDLLLSGHLHVHGTLTTAARYPLGNRSAIVVHAGTAVSTRVRGAHNSFNLVRMEHDRIEVSRFDWSPDRRLFAFCSSVAFVRRTGGWENAEVVIRRKERS